MNIAMRSRIAVRSRTGRPYPFAGRRKAARRLPFRSMGAGARRCAVLVAGLALLLIAGCGGGADQGPGRVVAVDTSEPVPWHSVDLDRSKAARAIAAAAARRHAELGRLRGVPSVGAALRRARLSGAIGRGAYRRYRAAYDGARGAAARLPGARGVEQRAVLGTVEALADGLALTPSRSPPCSSTCAATPGPGPRRRSRPPASGARSAAPRPCSSTCRDRACSCTRSRPGAGSTPACTAASTGPAPAAAAARCGARSTAPRASPPSAAASARGSTSTATPRARRRGSAAWRRRTAVQALARAARAFRAPRYAKLARQALGAFETAPPTGVAVPAAAGGERSSCTRSRRRCRSSTASCRRSTGCARRRR